VAPGDASTPPRSEANQSLLLLATLPFGGSVYAADLFWVGASGDTNNPPRDSECSLGEWKRRHFRRRRRRLREPRFERRHRFEPALFRLRLRPHNPQNISRVHFIKLELADDSGKPLSDTFYWRSDNAYKPGRTWTGPQFDGFEDLAHLPKIPLNSNVTWGRDANENVCTVAVKNPSKSLAFQVWLRLQHADNAKPVRPTRRRPRAGHN
jgi:hypothetical protein